MEILILIANMTDDFTSHDLIILQIHKI